MWWENKGKQRVMALRNRKSSLNSKGIKRRTIFAGLFLCVFLVLVFQYGGFLLSLNDVQNQQSQTESNSSRYKGDVNDHSTSNTTNKKRVKKNCKFAAAIDGYIEGCVNNCQGFSTLNEAKMRCSENELCTGITRIPWLDAHEQYELRSGSRVFASIDGQVSYRLSGCRSKSKDSALVNREYETKSKTLDTDDYDWGMKTDSNDDRGTTSKGSENITFERIGQIRFWEPPMDFENSYHKVGTFVNGDPTIFVGIASYRDPMCTATIERLFQWAKYPHRIFVGAAEQNAEGDIPCVNPKRPCKEDPEQLLCKYVNQIRIMPVKAKDAMGPTWGRHRADSLYRGEYFALQIDAHMFFKKDWDIDMITQWMSTKNENAVLTNYPSDSRNALDKDGNPRRGTTPIMCHTEFTNGLTTKHKAAPEIRPKDGANVPILQVWWAAGVSFSRGHRIARVPYDCCLPMLFDGEETSMAYRMWTNGYDFYAFHHSVVFHPYDRKKGPPLFWENSNQHPGAVTKAQNRLLKIYGMEDKIKHGDYDKTDLKKYGLGKHPGRPLRLFLTIFGVDYEKRKARDNCNAVQKYYIHNALTPYIREDGKGIDYSYVPSNVHEKDFYNAYLLARKKEGPYAHLPQPAGFKDSSLRSGIWS